MFFSLFFSQGKIKIKIHIKYFKCFHLDLYWTLCHSLIWGAQGFYRIESFYFSLWEWSFCHHFCDSCGRKNFHPLAFFQNSFSGASLVAQWLRTPLPMQGTRVRALVREDPTCRGAAKPVRHNYWACALEPVSHNYWAHVPQLLKLTHLEPVLSNKRSHRNEKPEHCNEE